MTPTPPDARLTVRLGARIGPEAIALILIVAVVLVSAALVIPGRRASTPPSERPSASIIPSGTPGISFRPNTSARAILVVVDGLLGTSARLVTELAKARTDAVAIAALLRDANASVVAQDTMLVDLASDPSTADLAARIQAVNAAASDAAHKAEQQSVANVAAYRDGAMTVVAALKPLLAIRAEVAVLAGEPNASGLAASQGAGALPAP
jgi:hypothetical protein